MVKSTDMTKTPYIYISNEDWIAIVWKKRGYSHLNFPDSLWHLQISIRNCPPIILPDAEPTM